MGNDPLYPAVEVSSPKDAPIRYSFCTLVTDQMQYRNMLASFQEAGFSTDDCEYLYLDNRAENRFDGYRGLNHLIAQASGRYVVLCHQDVLPFDNRATLDNRLLELFERDPDWAVAGNAGYDADRKKRFRLTHPYGFNIDTGGLPAAVETLDENFLILRRDSLLGFSHDLRGFHLYGTDLVTQARLRGRTSWVIDFHLEHLGVGTVDGSFMDSVDAFQNKYRHALRPRAVRSTVVKLAVGGTDLEARLKQWEKRYRIKNGKKPFARIGKLD